MRVAISVIVRVPPLCCWPPARCWRSAAQSLDRVLFEIISAFATVGLSTGLSAELPPPGVYVLAAADVCRPRRHHYPCLRTGPAPAPPAVPLPGREANHWLTSPAPTTARPTTPRCWSSGWAASVRPRPSNWSSRAARSWPSSGTAALVQKWAGTLTHVVEADATNIDALRQLGAQDFSSAVVGRGHLDRVQVLITVNLVDLGIEHLWVKAITHSHGKILTRIGANHVIYPEADAGVRAAHLVSGRMLDFIEFDDDFAIVKMYPPKETAGLHAGRVQGSDQVRRDHCRREIPRRGLHLRAAGNQGLRPGHADCLRPRGPAGALRRPAVAARAGVPSPAHETAASGVYPAEAPDQRAPGGQSRKEAP